MSWRLHPASARAAWSDHWSDLHARAGAPAVLHLDLMTAALDSFGRGDELVAAWHEAGTVRIMTLLTRDGALRWHTFQPAQAPLGAWLQAPDTDAQLGALLQGLLHALPGPALLLGLTQCDPLLMVRPADGGALHTMDYIDTARITLTGSFEAYWNARGKNLRANLKKQRARLVRDGVVTRMEVLRDSAQVARAVADYGTLESAGWKARGGSAVHADNDQGQFYRAMLEAFCQRGAGAIYCYWFDQRLVAMDLCIEDGAALVVLKTAYDESVAAGLSPTLLMREEACRALFDEGRLARIEFYGRVMEWHLRWTDEVRSLYHINHYRWPLLARLHGALRQRRARADARPAAVPESPLSITE